MADSDLDTVLANLGDYPDPVNVVWPLCFAFALQRDQRNFRKIQMALFYTEHYLTLAEWTLSALVRRRDWKSIAWAAIKFAALDDNAEAARVITRATVARAAKQILAEPHITQDRFIDSIRWENELHGDEALSEADLDALIAGCLAPQTGGAAHAR